MFLFGYIQTFNGSDDGHSYYRRAIYFTEYTDLNANVTWEH